MKKQLISSVACFVLLILMFVGSSIAWFTDTADSVNTMVAGKISIDQTEEFDGTQILLPSMTITKKVTVKNTGNQPAYVRTLFAFEDSADGKVLEMISTQGATIVIPGVTTGTADQKVQFRVTVTDANGNETTTLYTVGYYEYPTKLGVGESFVSMESFKLSERAGNDWQNAIGDKYEIIVLSQATQVTGMEGLSVEAALTQAFDVISSASCVTWFTYVLENTEGYVPAGGAMSVTQYPVATNP